jgi:sugar lactone lactonase YvrE
MFEVLGNGAATRLQWRGCLEPAADTFMNDVVGLSNGDVVYTRMFHDAGTAEMLLSLIGFDTGDLWRWSKQTGPQLLPGTTANQPNGLEISSDERHVFANMYVTQELWKVDVDTGEIVDVAAVANADNSAWGSDGRLWVTTHTAPLSDMIACAGSQELSCGASFAVIAVDPETMMTETIFAHAGPPMGAATVAVPQAGRVYMGSFVGDRLMSSVDFLQAAP